MNNFQERRLIDSAKYRQKVKQDKRLNIFQLNSANARSPMTLANAASEGGMEEKVNYRRLRGKRFGEMEMVKITSIAE